MHSHASQLDRAMATRRIIVGVTGTNGAGKGTVVDRLVTKYNFAHYSVRGYLLGEMKKRKIKNTDRDAMRRLANEIRANQSPSYIVEQLFDEAQRPVDSCPDVPISIIESIRVPMEALALRRRAEGNFFFWQLMLTQPRGITVLLSASQKLTASPSQSLCSRKSLRCKTQRNTSRT